MGSTTKSAIIGAAITLIVFFLTKISDFFSNWHQQKKKRQSEILALRTELALNRDICAKIMETDGAPRTSGFDFSHTVWNSFKKSLIYKQGIPGELIYNAYSKMLMYNLLKIRRREILNDPKYPNPDKAVGAERQEMMDLLIKLKQELDTILRSIKLQHK